MKKKEEKNSMDKIYKEDGFPVPTNSRTINEFNDLLSPMCYYSKFPTLWGSINVAYISDIHLEYHEKYYYSKRKMMRNIAEQLCVTNNANLILFCGDIGETPETICEFFKYIHLTRKYKLYLQEKSRLIRNEKASLKIPELSRRINRLKRELSKWVDYDKMFALKTPLEEYVESNYWRKRNLPEFVKLKLLTLLSLERELGKYKPIALCDAPSGYARNAHLSCEQCACPNTFFVLGNHELFAFDTVEEGVAYYKRALARYGVTILHNETFEAEGYVLYGGIGFAGYNEQYNANNILSCGKMNGNRKYEKEETAKFERAYQDARLAAKTAKKCFLCASHYPPTHCLRNVDCDAIYFYGHDHHNFFRRDEFMAAYADNQIGYHKDGRFNCEISFKNARLGTTPNPYFELTDGCHKTTIMEYEQFLHYSGLAHFAGKNLKKICSHSTFYVIKKRGLLGFFLVDSKNGTYIATGRGTKKISLSSDISWVENNFEIIATKYLTALAPLRKYQEAISQALSDCGLSGNIHGCIVDLDFYHHIMINPFDGTVIFYRSPAPGIIYRFETFTDLLFSIGDDVFKRVLSSKHASFLLGTKELQNINANEKPTPIKPEAPVKECVSLSTGMYGISRKISPLQAIFTHHVLKTFDISLAEIKSEKMAKRKISYRGRIFRLYESGNAWLDGHNGKLCLITEDDLSETVTICNLSERESRKIPVVALRSWINRKAEWITYSAEETRKLFPDYYKENITEEKGD